MSIEKLKVRILNGYRVIYVPDHPKAMTSENWKGFVYEHIIVAEKKLGRELNDDEIVHHLDNNLVNNLNENLVVMNRLDHLRLIKWLKKTNPNIKTENVYYNDGKVPDEKLKNIKYCKICGNILQKGQDKFCSYVCVHKQRSIDATEDRGGKSKPSKEQLEEDMKTLPWIHIGAKYGVSDNAARKWAKGYGLETKKERIVTKTNPSHKKIYNTIEEKRAAKNKRKREKYSNMSVEEKLIRKFGK